MAQGPLNAELIAERRAEFPPMSFADKNGLLCFGGDLRPERLLAAYSLGIFPWYDENNPILWWSLTPRCVLLPGAFHLPRRAKRSLRKEPFELTWDKSFAEVIKACAAPRAGEASTWLIEEMQQAYLALHRLGFAHSVEAWRDGQLVGGLYGIGLGRAFFGESMFHRTSEASRAALAGLVALLALRDVVVLDCQQESPHMMAMGATLLSRHAFEAKLRKAGLGPGEIACDFRPWTEDYAWLAESSSWSEKSK
ncbi:MAG: leucyl/phenylalanyl-tRNA--protein transferase [Desulfovibrio sp.]|nr:leucyl/phenylalanyl-tRNA--protein transferase [Desulfovibrio sp.]